LVKSAGGSNKAGKALKSSSGWYNNGNGADTYGFSALPGGLRGYSVGSFGDAGDYGHWWTATAGESGYAYNRLMDCYDDYVYEYYDVVGYGFSVRCVGD
jgi:uncharacterized protein (TIGR02145 family)